jgi:CheY-like chemotaxis protein
MSDGNLSRLAVVIASGSRVETNLLHLLEEALKSELPVSRLKFGVALGAAALLRDSVVWDALVADATRAGASDVTDAALTAAAEIAADMPIVSGTDDSQRALVETIRAALTQAFHKERAPQNEDAGVGRCAKVARLVHALCIVRVAQKEHGFRPTLSRESDRAPALKRRSTLPSMQAVAAPTSERAPLSEPVPSLARIPDSTSHIGLRVLVISPDGSTRRAITRLLSPFEVVDVDSAAATLGLLKSYRAFDVVLLDGSMDEAAGASLARTISDSWPMVGERIFFIRQHVAVPLTDPEARVALSRVDLVDAVNRLRRKSLAKAKD